MSASRRIHDYITMMLLIHCTFGCHVTSCIIRLKVCVQDAMLAHAKPNPSVGVASV